MSKRLVNMNAHRPVGHPKRLTIQTVGATPGIRTHHTTGRNPRANNSIIRHKSAAK